MSLILPEGTEVYRHEHEDGRGGFDECVTRFDDTDVVVWWLGQSGMMEVIVDETRVEDPEQVKGAQSVENLVRDALFNQWMRQRMDIAVGLREIFRL